MLTQPSLTSAEAVDGASPVIATTLTSEARTAVRRSRVARSGADAFMAPTLHDDCKPAVNQAGRRHGEFARCSPGRCSNDTLGVHSVQMRRWWDRTLEYFADYIAVYGWADPTSTMPPTWIDDPRWDHGGEAGQQAVRSSCASSGSGNDPQRIDRRENTS
jgi:hypothetical protein